MPYFNNNDINVLFIHIPKTGGSSVEYYFSKKFNIKLNNNSLYLHNKTYLLHNKINSSLQHITYNQIVENSKEFNINFDNIKIITIVRNPYERIVSDLFFCKLITTDTTKEEVFDIIDKYLVSTNFDNHNIPQHNFITNDNKEIIQNIHILKTESLGYTDFNICIHVNNNKINNKKINYYDYLNNKSIDIIIWILYYLIMIKCLLKARL
jgi:hypothetical protein